MTDQAMGYCIHCGDYGAGRYRWPHGDTAEAIDQHIGCPISPPAAPDPPAAPGTAPAS